MGEIFLKILNMSITAGWLILAVLCIRLLFRKMPKWVNCLLWGVVAIRLIVPFSVESSLSLQPSAQPIQSSTVVSGEVLPYVPSVDSNLSIVENTVNPMLAETFAYSEEESVAPLQVVTEVAGIVWVIGMILLLVFALGSIIRLSLLVKESVPYMDNLFICDGVKSPFILGIIRPRIYLSSSLTEEEMEYIVAHERAHLKRKDYLWKPFGYLLLCIYWFNPLCWVAYMMLCKDIELACDEKVIRNMNFENKKEYSRVLLACATQRRLVMACPLAFGEVGVKERVKTVLNYKKPTFWITLVAIVICVVVAICFLTNPEKEYQIRITIPAGSTEEIVYQEDFFYSEEEISPTGNKITISLGEGSGDTEVVLKPVKVKEENAYEPTYMTPGMPVKMDVEKGAWFRIGVNMQNPTEEDIDVYVIVKGVEVRISSERTEESDNSIYGNIIAGLGDNETYAFLDMDYDNMVLLTSDLVYDEGTEKQAAVYCDVYYPVGGEVKKLGSIMSDGTAYPITFTKDGIFAASGHKIEKYVISTDGTLYLEKGIYEQFDETGNEIYVSVVGEQENESTEQEYQEMVNEYGTSQIVHFSYGAKDSVNEYQKTEPALNLQETEKDTVDLKEDAVMSPPELRLYDTLSSQGEYYSVQSGTYAWTYLEEGEAITLEASGEMPTTQVKLEGPEHWLKIPAYNGADSVLYLVEFEKTPDYIEVKEYDLLELGDIDPALISEETYSETYLIELNPRRIYEVNAVWEEENLEENGFYGKASYAFAVSDVRADVVIEEHDAQQTNIVDELPDKEAFVVTNIFTTETKPLIAEDGLTLSDILENGSWNTEATTECLSNIEITINGVTYNYHSGCGTFNDNANNRYLSLDDEMQNLINALLADYISLVETEVPVE